MILEEFHFKREVLEDPGAVLVDFWAPWCGPCRAMQPTLESISRHSKVCKVNIDSNPALAAKFQVEIVPTILIFRAGQIQQRFEGVVSEATLMSALAAH